LYSQNPNIPGFCHIGKTKRNISSRCMTGQSIKKMAWFEWLEMAGAVKPGHDGNMTSVIIWIWSFRVRVFDAPRA
jgi:hypothetical protein